MKRHRFKILLGALLLGLIAAWMFWPAPPQPSYQGQPLGKWLEALARNRNDTNALAAIANLGTNAVPTMAEAVNQAPGRFRRTIFDFASEATKKLRLRSEPFEDVRDVRALGGLRGFELLRLDATNAIPALGETVNWNGYAAEALGYTGPMAFPTLTNALTTCSRDKRLPVLFAIGRGGTNAAAAVPLIVPLLQDMSYCYQFPVRRIAAATLGFIHSRPDIALPAITNLFADTDLDVRRHAVESVVGFCADAKPITGALTNLLNDPDRQVRQSASRALESIAQNQPVWPHVR